MMIIRIWFEYCRVKNASRVRLQTRSSYEAGKRAHRVLNSITSNSNKQVKTTSPIVMREHMQLIHQAFIKSDMSLSSVMHMHLSYFFSCASHSHTNETSFSGHLMYLLSVGFSQSIRFCISKMWRARTGFSTFFCFSIFRTKCTQKPHRHLRLFRSNGRNGDALDCVGVSKET